ncbi:hypothetical protein OJF2_51360 [Aquisphaera giovannonii]|uniref:Uncharacterized protein n=1 Tax=Aquisphaera giovannonii TaxID=406548 RepID=A0A5B9W796_9BACT|nr:hypothetical protein [Aquisphaera giovannonii]QEH36552.1 hypothetical protein OJF2_51360 [Aquisphaera giovannonii]
MKPFDNYEISPCRRFEEPGKPGLFYFEVCEPHDAHVWTLYGHIPGEGVMAIGDFASREETEETFQRITGIPFGTHEEVESRLRVMHAGARLLVACDNVQRAHVGDGITMAEAVDACLLAIAEAAGTRPIHPSADPLEALQLASAYIQYVKVRNPELHVEADGSPSVEAAIAEAIGRAA